MKRSGKPAGEDFADNRVPGKGQKKVRKNLTAVTELDNQGALIRTHIREYQDMAETLLNLTWHDGIGSFGAALMVVAYYWLQSGKFDGETALYFWLNGVGSVLIMVSLTMAFNFAAFAIEVFWLLISAMGLWKTRRGWWRPQ